MPTPILRSFLSLTFVAVFSVSGVQAQKASRSKPVKTAAYHQPSPAEVSRQVEGMLARLSLKEKIGQMTQITIDVVGKGGNVYASDEPFALDPAKVRKAVVEYGVGSILNTGNNMPRTREVWCGIVDQLQEVALHDAPSKIPVLYGIDAIHGATYTVDATMFPQQISLAAGRNRAMARKLGRITAYEVRASGQPWTFSPVLDLGSDPRSPRQWETFGEDPYLAAEMGHELIKGYEGDSNDVGHPEHVASCAKHFVGYQVTASGKDRTNANIPTDALHEYHVPPFRAAVKAGTLSFMINSGLVNNYPVHANGELLSQLLKKELGFEGLAVTDWADIENLHTRDHLAATPKEAIRMTINAGIDMSMVPYHYEPFCKDLLELVKEGSVSQSRIDDAVRRILTLKVKLGLFERPTTSYKDYPLFGSKQHETASYEAAAEAITLLKNEGDILPLAKTAKLLVTGPNAATMRTLNGAWTWSWQGDRVDQFAGKYNTILKALNNRAMPGGITYVPGVRYKAGGKYYEEEKDRMDEAVAAAKAVDVILLCLGENSYVEKPGDLNDLYLSDLQTELAHRLIATGKPVVLVLTEGRPRLISKFEPSLKAVVQGYLPGNFGGDALADVLYGEVNPSGKLPYTYPRYPNAVVSYIHKSSDEQKKAEGVYNYEADYNPQYEFGAGLSYTRFTISNLKVDKGQVSWKGILQISVEVANTGKRAGKTTVELYSSDQYASRIAPDVRRLRRFEKISLQPGEKKTVTFSLPASELAYAGPDGNPVMENGAFTLSVDAMRVPITVQD